MTAIHSPVQNDPSYDLAVLVGFAQQLQTDIDTLRAEMKRRNHDDFAISRFRIIIEQKREALRVAIRTYYDTLDPQGRRESNIREEKRARSQLYGMLDRIDDELYIDNHTEEDDVLGMERARNRGMRDAHEKSNTPVDTYFNRGRR